MGQVKGLKTAMDNDHAIKLQNKALDELNFNLTSTYRGQEPVQHPEPKGRWYISSGLGVGRHVPLSKDVNNDGQYNHMNVEVTPGAISAQGSFMW